MWLSLAQGVAGGAAGAIGAGIANSQDPQGPRIKELSALQGSGRLDRTDQMLVDQDLAASRRAADEANQAVANQMALTGSSSGRDVEGLAAAATAGEQAATDKARASWAKAFGAEGQELADRKAIRHDRQMEIVNNIQAGLGGSAAATGMAAGASQNVAKMPDVSSLNDGQKAAVKQIMSLAHSGKITPAQAQQMLDMLAGKGDVAAGSSAKSGSALGPAFMPPTGVNPLPAEVY